MQPQPLDDLVEAVLSGPDYHHISVDLVRWIGRQEIGKRRNLKEAVKFTRSRLHQIAAAYQKPRVEYGRWLEELSSLPHEIDDPQLKDFCRRVMSHHTSTRERLPILEPFFNRTLSRIAPLHSILDIGCGLNPLALPWMPLAEDITYYGLDIYSDQAAFLNVFLSHTGVSGSVQVHNVLNGLPDNLPCTQVTLLLKTLPCLEQLDKTISRRLLETIRACHLVISYPLHSLGGRSKGMLQNYQNHFEILAGQLGWMAERLEFQTELVFIVEL